jgi:hypothetical protein
MYPEHSVTDLSGPHTLRDRDVLKDLVATPTQCSISFGQRLQLEFWTRMIPIAELQAIKALAIAQACHDFSAWPVRSAERGSAGVRS